MISSLPITFTGVVEHGDGYGHVLGYPTANVDYSWLQAVSPNFPDGVYAGYVTLSGGKRYKAGIVIGAENLHGLPKVEAHLIGFDGDLYGQHIQFEITHFLREYKVFASVDDLVHQIGVDIREAHLLLP